MRGAFFYVLMKKYLFFLLTVCLLMAFPGCSERVENDLRHEKVIAIVGIGQIEEQLLERVSDFVGKNYWCRVRTTTHRTSFKKTLNEEAKEITKLVRKDDICLLALVSIPGNEKFWGKLYKSLNVGLLNISALRPDKLDSDKQREKYARRVEKESMRVIGLLLGLETCPFPRCALSIARTEQELDAKGRNLCPPCRIKAEKILKEMGVTLISRRFVPPSKPEKKK